MRGNGRGDRDRENSLLNADFKNGLSMPPQCTRCRIMKTTLGMLLLLAAASIMAMEPGEGRMRKGRKGLKGPMMGHMFQMMDTDKDGKVSKQEWQAHHDKRFSELDADKDGFITQEEMKAHHEKMMEKGGMMGPRDDGDDQGEKPRKKKKAPKGEE